jgi:hypothetical protein
VFAKDDVPDRLSGRVRDARVNEKPHAARKASTRR